MNIYLHHNNEQYRQVGMYIYKKPDKYKENYLHY